MQFKQLIISLDREDEDDDDEKTKPLPTSKSNNIYSGSSMQPSDNTDYHMKNKIDLAGSGASSSGTPVANSLHPNQSANYVSSAANMNNSYAMNHSQVCFIG